MDNTQEQAVSYEQLLAEHARLQAQLDELNAKYERLLEKYMLKIKKIFGRSREAINGQTVLEGVFNEAEVESDTAQPEPAVEEVAEAITKLAKKFPGQKKAKLEGLPIERIDYGLPEEARTCWNCGEPLSELKPVIRTRIEVIPAQIKVVEEVKHIYAPCNKCDVGECEEHGIVNASMPEAAVPHSIATESTIAFVIVEKYQYGIPLNRQETMWRMADLHISRQTMANWVILASDMWLRLISDRMHNLLILRDIVMADESGIQVLHEAGRPATSKSYMWLYRSGTGPPIVLFDYRQTREAKHPEKFLSGFSGYLCTDGYAAYYGLPAVINVSCFAHGRRGFYDAFMALPKKARNKESASFKGLHFCDRLFDVERSLRGMDPQERYNERLSKSQPILDEFKKWLDLMRPNAEDKSYLGKAVKYCLNQWNTLCNFMLDGRLEIDNNASERCIRNYAIGRRGWMFANTPKGAEASAIAYSIVQTAVANKLKPFEYIQYLLKYMPNSNVKDQAVLDSFLPWSESIPESCKIKVFPSS